MIVAKWINRLLLLQSQARDTEPPSNANENHPERTVIFRGPLPGALKLCYSIVEFCC